eukprot:TRINITY_DN1907_c0_g1_i1.p1 TRINITY_DN1907_c0_g1~~TRINITY_DN1907_c0_g1_i1.p1  ORF type:complete len:140 (+),score=31.95 TRINITY_DN1907_c0_g1_i1:101-520(+)
MSATPAPILKPGKVVILTRGRYAGHKAVIVLNSDKKTKDKPFTHAVVAGIERYPLKVTSDMGKRKVARRSRVKAFIKTVNHNHVMPTRYGLDVDFATVLKNGAIHDKAQRNKKELEVKRLFEERYRTGRNRWFFTKLRF